MSTEAQFNQDFTKTLATPEQIAAAQAAGDAFVAQQEAAQGGSGSSSPRTIPCPDCGTDENGREAKQMINPKKKTSIDISGYLRKLGSAARLPFNIDLGAALSSNRKVPTAEVFDKPGCPTCGDKRVIEDKTDQSQQVQAASQEAQALQKEILDLEAKLGPTGGNRHTIVVGDDMLEVGLGYNDSKSYKIIEDASLTRSGVKMNKKGPTKVSGKVNAVVGTNPLATPGGHYTIKCSNKFTVRAGAQGIELNTEGPLIIKAGQTQFVGPEITIGSAKGQVVVEGQALNLNGKCISLNPDSTGEGQVSVGGTMHTTGNIVAQGGAHIEGDMSCISMTMPGKVERSKHASQDVQTSGAAVWLAQAAAQALKDNLRIRAIRAADPAGLALSPRDIQNLIEEVKEATKKALPIEPLPTGIIPTGTQVLLQGTCPCNQGGTAAGAIVATVVAPIFLHNFPHHHTLGDMIHAHDNKVPNWNLLDDDEAVRSAGQAKATKAPVTANVSNANDNIFTQAFAGVIGTVSAIIQD
jgi:predicted RNA-binding Zn-ribbon protein involved in translation (DUF1610 family)